MNNFTKKILVITVLEIFIILISYYSLMRVKSFNPGESYKTVYTYTYDTSKHIPTYDADIKRMLTYEDYNKKLLNYIKLYKPDIYDWAKNDLLNKKFSVQNEDNKIIFIFKEKRNNNQLLIIESIFNLCLYDGNNPNISRHDTDVTNRFSRYIQNYVDLQIKDDSSAFFKRKVEQCVPTNEDEIYKAGINLATAQVRAHKFMSVNFELIEKELQSSSDIALYRSIGINQSIDSQNKYFLSLIKTFKSGPTITEVMNEVENSAKSDFYSLLIINGILGLFLCFIVLSFWDKIIQKFNRTFK